MIIPKNNIEPKKTKSIYYYIVDPDTNQVIDRIDRQSYDYHKWKQNKDIQPNFNFDNEF